MTTDLRSHVETSELTATQIAARTRRIYDTVLQESPSLDGGNFTTIHTSDLARLFDHYDTTSCRKPQRADQAEQTKHDVKGGEQLHMEGHRTSIKLLVAVTTRLSA